MMLKKSRMCALFLFYNNVAICVTTISSSCVTHFIVQNFIEQGDTNRKDR